MTEPEDSEAAPRGAVTRRRKWPYWSCGTLLVLLVAPVVYLALAGAAFRMPDWLASRVETAVNARMDGAHLSLSGLDLIFEAGLKPRVQMRNVGVSDRNGTEIAVLNQVSASLSPQQFFRGAATMKALNISGAIITVRRSATGEFNLVLGQGAGAEGDLAQVLDAVDEAFAEAPLDALGEVTADGVTISLEDARSGRIWQVTDGRVALTHSAEDVALRVEADVFNGTDELASTVIGFQIEKGSSRATLHAQFQNALATDIAAQSPVLSFLSVLDAPISGSLRTTIGDDGQVDDLAGTLTIASGALKPTPNTPPIPFDFGQAYLDFEPETQTIELTQLTFESEAASVDAEGTAILQDFRGGWPSTLVGQFRVSDMRLQPKGVFAEPMAFESGAFEFRAKLDPFSVDIGQVSLGPPERRVLAKGRVAAKDAGWAAALDLSLNRISPERVISLWPVAVAKGARRWVDGNVIEGAVSDLRVALRLRPNADVNASMSFIFDEAVVRALDFLPPITEASGYASLDGKSFTAVVEAGAVAAPEGGPVELGGSFFRVVDVTASVERAEVMLNTSASIEATLSLLNQEPLALLEDTGIEPRVAAGRAEADALLSFDLIRDLSIEDVDFKVAGRLLNVRSDQLIEDRVLAADALEFTADEEAIEIFGPATVDGLPVNGRWRQVLGPEAVGQSQVTGTLELSQTFLDTFGIALPPGTLSGSGVGDIALDLEQGAPPRFELASDLNRVGLTVPELGWSKARNQTGSLEVVGRLGDVPSIDRLALSAPGLALSGVVDLGPDGALETAQFDRVRVGGWLDTPVTLTGRPGRAPAVLLNGGTVDLRQAAFGSGGSGESGPLSLRLNRLTISEGIALTNMRGDFQSGRGLEGRFTGNVNGGPPIRGSVVPTPSGTAIQIESDSAGETLAAAGVLQNIRGGTMQLTLSPTGAEGTYDGRLRMSNARLFKTPALTDLLNAVSVVGLIDQLNAGGILLSDVEAEFRLTPDLLTLYYSSAVGPSIGVSLDGLYGMETKRLDMQGVISPVYFLNGIGQIFSRGRDGLFGFNFRMTGAADDPRVSVNPLSILTPGAFRDIFRRPPPVPNN